jgi:hypothetical protein
MAPKPLLRIRSHAKKTFGEAFGAATGVSDPSYKKTRIRNHLPAATPPLWRTTAPLAPEVYP